MDILDHLIGCKKKLFPRPRPVNRAIIADPKHQIS
jgi:hypothetical protein